MSDEVVNGVVGHNKYGVAGFGNTKKLGVGSELVVSVQYQF